MAAYDWFRRWLEELRDRLLGAVGREVSGGAMLDIDDYLLTPMETSLGEINQHVREQVVDDLELPDQANLGDNGPARPADRR